ncbi:copper amine oxidase N-terminal domain-containing protein [Paenibacillus polysaccharolyticus]|nr:copper amine oxidase N-terminal domain-containing protein [Paenibacillus polysaccharolyticus]
MSLNKDSYFLGKNASHKLGAVKEMRNGYVYVPLEFLSNILNLKVIQDNKQGQITISNTEN